MLYYPIAVCPLQLKINKEMLTMYIGESTAADINEDEDEFTVDYF